ncbi:YdcF family protein [Paenibacillus kobensis]|uniref:YdcF family protein n=1 Tax=Paenibacillus kobensis TaxID=59841 RepID=UPI000FD8C584|nr:YdcF family protein [Paenibacillus kobensis]
MKRALTKSTKPSSGLRRNRRRKPLLVLFRLVLSFAVLGVLWCGYILWSINSVTIPKTIPKADVAVVLGAALWNDRPSPGLKERLDHAYALYKEGKTDKLILTGGLDHNGSKLTEAEGMRRYLTGLGVPPDKLLLEPKATSTYENMLFSKAIIDREKFKSVIIVTHDYHTARSKEIAKYVGIERPVMAPFKSDVLKPVYNETREVLAFTKWKVDAVAMQFGVEIKVPEIAYFNH